MASVDLIAGTIMDGAASLMNDTAKSIYTYVKQVPYLQIAMDELQQKYELNAIPVTETVSTAIYIPAGATEILFNNSGGPSLPSDFIEPMQLWERNHGIDPYVPMTRKEFLPHQYEGTPTNQFLWYVWQDNKIKVLPSTTDNDIKMDYIKSLFLTLVDENSPINVINAVSFLKYRTAALLAEFIERNTTSSNSLNAYASLGMDMALGIGVKGTQAINTRRLPFRSGWKRRSSGSSW